MPCVDSVSCVGNMYEPNYKRVTLFAGHYGSGKTNIAVSYALMLRRHEDSVSIADLDIVNPYFRTKDSLDVLSRAGISLISSEYAGTNVDIPALPAEAYAIVENRSLHAVIDVGGDDRGATALGRYVPYLVDENSYEMLFVVNRFRPLTPDAASTLEIMREIEKACSLKFTAIVNNSNLGALTTVQDVLSSVSYAQELSMISGLPVKMTTAREDIAAQLDGRLENIFPIKLHEYGFTL